MQKDYYKTLGVIQDAEDIVIKAAYRALAQRYHPDKWTGDPAEATRRMSAINVAYKILSDPAKRKQYDQSRASDEYDESSDVETEDSFGNSLDDDWKEAIKYFPDLDDILINLSKISKPLAQTYKVYLLENKEFSKREAIAAQFEMRFLEKYFGANKEIIKFARFLINLRARAAAKDLNRAVTLLGKNVDSQLIINRILHDYPDVSAAYQSPPQKPDNPSDSHTGTSQTVSRTNAAIPAFISGVVIVIVILVIALPSSKPEGNKYVKPEYTQLTSDDGRAAYSRGDYTQAIRIWESLANQGNASVQNHLGRMYLLGDRVAQNYPEALKWFRLAASQGQENAQTSIGWMYHKGLGLAQNYNEALKWYRLAAAQGDVDAQSNLGQMYYEGKGVAQNYPEALKWFRLAAVQGYAYAEFRLGSMYNDGNGVTQNYNEALKWYRLAAAQGDAEARNNLGEMYQSGQGVTQDYQEALKWYLLAAAQGNLEAQNRLQLPVILNAAKSRQ